MLVPRVLGLATQASLYFNRVYKFLKAVDALPYNYKLRAPNKISVLIILGKDLIPQQKFVKTVGI